MSLLRLPLLAVLCSTPALPAMAQARCSDISRSAIEVDSTPLNDIDLFRRIDAALWQVVIFERDHMAGHDPLPDSTTAILGGVARYVNRDAVSRLEGARALSTLLGPFSGTIPPLLIGYYYEQWHLPSAPAAWIALNPRAEPRARAAALRGAAASVSSRELEPLLFLVACDLSERLRSRVSPVTGRTRPVREVADEGELKLLSELVPRLATLPAMDDSATALTAMLGANDPIVERVRDLRSLTSSPRRSP